MQEIKNLAKTVRSLRRAGPTNRQKLVTKSGLSDSTIYRIENSHKKVYNPKLDTLAYLAHGLDTTLSALLTQPVGSKRKVAYNWGLIPA